MALERRFEGHQRYSSRKVEVKASIMCHVTFAFCGEHTSLNRDSSCAFFVFLDTAILGLRLSYYSSFERQSIHLQTLFRALSNPRY